jgi:hypothetical protein
MQFRIGYSNERCGSFGDNYDSMRWLNPQVWGKTQFGFIELATL